jgi:ABC-type proline/glycine betaine transport system ATPase subunit
MVPAFEPCCITSEMYLIYIENGSVNQHPIILKKVRVHNLKSVDLTLEPNQFIVFTGVSGSGKAKDVTWNRFPLTLEDR